VEGSSDSLQLFLDQQTEAPPLLIEEINYLYVASDGDKAFEIRQSRPEKKYQRIRILPVPPVARKSLITKTGVIVTFTSAQLGPRFTIIKDIPIPTGNCEL
jgi:hydrogenase maturation factor HypF (carbamoyltransferase family)